MNKVLSIWQKYSLVDSDLVDKLNKIASTAKIDSVLNSSDEKQTKKLNGKTSSSASILSAKKEKKKHSAEKSCIQKPQSNGNASSPSELTTKNEIHRVRKNKSRFQKLYIEKFDIFVVVLSFLDTRIR